MEAGRAMEIKNEQGDRGLKRALVAGKQRAAWRKLAGRGGFTMTELLLCTLIMLLSTALVVQTLELSIRHFQSQTRHSDAQLLANTLAVAIQNKITHAVRCEEMDEEDTKKVVFTGDMTTKSVRYRIEPDDDGFLVMNCFAAKTTSGVDQAVKIPLTDRKTYGEDTEHFKASVDLSKDEKGYIFVALRILWKEAVETETAFTVRPVT